MTGVNREGEGGGDGFSHEEIEYAVEHALYFVRRAEREKGYYLLLGRDGRRVTDALKYFLGARERLFKELEGHRKKANRRKGDKGSNEGEEEMSMD